MTKNIKQKTDWEVEFDKQFVKDNGPNCESSFSDPNGQVGPVKLFIRQTLSEQLERVEGMKVEPAVGHPAQFNYESEWYQGYNSALDDVLNTMRKELS